ncbi:MAG: menaquinone biosynthesis protein [Thermoanaerobaculia bacterium]|nr:menaquinone biosynthesis protein [Thermoanaerobaculia bacterium]
MEISTTPLRVGIVSFLNSWPLAWSFLTGVHPSLEHELRVTPSFLRPSEVADQLAQGEVDIGLIPSAELQRIPDLSLIPGLCVASDREVTSVLLVSKVPIEEIRRVGLDTSSRTSAVLVQILLAARGVRAEYTPVAPNLETMFDGNDAALVIGDLALEIDRDRYLVVDLASEWRALTDLPFVFAVWAVRPLPADVPEPMLVDLFRQSLEWGRSSLDAVVERAVRDLDLDPGQVHRYLTEHLKYDLGIEELASLVEFFRRGHALGLLPRPMPLRFLEAGAMQAPLGAGAVTHSDR